MEEIGQRLLEKVVRETVDVQHGTVLTGIGGNTFGSAVPDQGRRDRVLTVGVGAEGNRRDLISVEIPVGVPGQPRLGDVACGGFGGVACGGFGDDGCGIVGGTHGSTLRRAQRSRVPLLSPGAHRGVAGSDNDSFMGKNDR